MFLIVGEGAVVPWKLLSSLYYYCSIFTFICQIKHRFMCILVGYSGVYFGLAVLFRLHFPCSSLQEIPARGIPVPFEPHPFKHSKGQQ